MSQGPFQNPEAETLIASGDRGVIIRIYPRLSTSDPDVRRFEGVDLYRVIPSGAPADDPLENIDKIMSGLFDEANALDVEGVGSTASARVTNMILRNRNRQSGTYLDERLAGMNALTQSSDDFQRDDYEPELDSETGLTLYGDPGEIIHQLWIMNFIGDAYYAQLCGALDISALGADDRLQILQEVGSQMQSVSTPADDNLTPSDANERTVN